MHTPEILTPHTLFFSSPRRALTGNYSLIIIINNYNYHSCYAHSNLYYPQVHPDGLLATALYGTTNYCPSGYSYLTILTPTGHRHTWPQPLRHNQLLPIGLLLPYNTDAHRASPYLATAATAQPTAHRATPPTGHRHTWPQPRRHNQLPIGLLCPPGDRHTWPQPLRLNQLLPIGLRLPYITSPTTAPT